MTTSIPSKPPIKKQHVPPKPTTWLIASIAILFVLTMFFIYWQLQAIQQKTNALDTAFTLLTEQQNSNEARLKAYQVNTQKTQAAWQDDLNTLNKTLKTTLKEYTNLSDDWRLLKARYLLELAVLNAHWGTDKSVTVAMLREADTFLAPIHNPKLLPVREGLAQDITEQLSAPTTDITGLLTHLSAIQTQIFDLPVIPLPTEALADKSSEISGRMDNIIHFLKNLVVIRYRTDSLEPKPTLSYEAMLRATVRLNLQEAVWAILEHNDTIYHLALNQAMNNLERSFSSEAAPTQALIKQIKQLNTTPLSTTASIPKQGLSALNTLISTSIETSSSTQGIDAL